MPHNQLLNLSKLSYLQAVVVQINVWLKGILNFFKSRGKWTKKPLLMAVERAQKVALLMERLSESQRGRWQKDYNVAKIQSTAP